MWQLAEHSLVFILGHEVPLQVGGGGAVAGGEVLPLVLVPAEAPLAMGGVGVLLGPGHIQRHFCIKGSKMPCPNYQYCPDQQGVDQSLAKQWFQPLAE